MMQPNAANSDRTNPRGRHERHEERAEHDEHDQQGEPDHQGQVARQHVGERARRCRCCRWRCRPRRAPHRATAATRSRSVAHQVRGRLTVRPPGGDDLEGQRFRSSDSPIGATATTSGVHDSIVPIRTCSATRSSSLTGAGRSATTSSGALAPAPNCSAVPGEGLVRRRLLRAPWTRRAGRGASTPPGSRSRAGRRCTRPPAPTRRGAHRAVCARSTASSGIRPRPARQHPRAQQARAARGEGDGHQDRGADRRRRDRAHQAQEPDRRSR